MRSQLSTVTIILGIYLIAEAVGSFLFVADGNPLFQLGRVLRIIIGIFIILVTLKMIK